MDIVKHSPGEVQIVSNIDTRVGNFLKIFNINDLSNITISSLLTSNVIFVNTHTECTQFEVNFNIPINFIISMKIIYPRGSVINEHTEIDKLRINIDNEVVKHEIISCVNYLQRQKNINLALSVLKRCAALVTERRLILEMLILHSEGFISYSDHEDGGVIIKCVNPHNAFLYFESNWRIQFDCSNNLVMDYVDFSISILDPGFYRMVKPIVNNLVQASLMYNVKVEFWWKLIYAVSESVTQEVLGGEEVVDNNSFLNVPSLLGNRFIKYEIAESDDEDCVIIDD